MPTLVTATESSCGTTPSRSMKNGAELCDSQHIERHAPIRIACCDGVLIGVLPVYAISWHTLNLPKIALRGQKLRAVIRGILEEELLDDPEQMHFAIGPKQTESEGTWVAVCDRNWLKFNLKSLARDGYHPKRLIAECVPYHWKDTLPEAIISKRNTQFWMTWGDKNGVYQIPLESAHTSEELVSRISSKKFSQIFVDEDAPSSIYEIYPEAKTASLEAQISKVVASEWDLAQHEFAPRNKLKAIGTALVKTIACDKHWLPTRIAFLFLALSFLVGTNLLAWKERQYLKHQERLMVEMFHLSFPNIKTIIDPLLQMQKEVAQLRRMVGVVERGDAEYILTSFGATQISKDPAILNVTFEYGKESGLIIYPVRLDDATFSTTRAALQTKGIGLERSTDGLRLLANGKN